MLKPIKGHPGRFLDTASGQVLNISEYREDDKYDTIVIQNTEVPAAFTIAAGTLVGRFGASGNLQLGITVAVGFLISFLGILAVQGGAPGGFSMWFADVVVGFLGAFVGVGVYKADVHASAKGAAIAAQQDK